MNHHALLILHLLSASIWVGGHLFLMFRIFPEVLKNRDTLQLLTFENKYEPLGMGALIMLVVTGLMMASNYGISPKGWLAFTPGIGRMVSTKLILLLATVGVALSALTRVIPSLKQSPCKLPEMAIHASIVTLLGITMLMVGSYGRYGGF